MKGLLCSIDPGRDKTGVALVHAEEIFALVMGNGTRHEVMQERTEALLSKLGREIPVTLVDEKYTTEMGEQWYWKDHPAKGLARLIPKGMRSVPVPVAWIIGCIYLGIVKAEDVGHKKV